MWSPVRPHVQWDLSNVVTYETSCTVGPILMGSAMRCHFLRWIRKVAVSSKLIACKTWKVHILGLNLKDGQFSQETSP